MAYPPNFAMLDVMDWNDFQYVLALARSGSVRAAGSAMGVSHSTVLRRVEALEAQLSTRLFDRSRDGYALTEAGRQILPRIEGMEREMSALERSVAGQDEQLVGTVTITCCDTWVARLLIRELKPMCETHQAIELSINADARPFDLSKREADIAIRALVCDTTPPEHLIGVKLAPLVMGNYVATAHAPHLDPDIEGTSPRWASFDNRAIQDLMVEQSSYAHVPSWGAFASVDLAVQAALEGYGLVALPTYVGDVVPGLRRLAHPDLRHVADLWLVSHPDLRTNARLRITREAICAAFVKHAALFRDDGAPVQRLVLRSHHPHGPQSD